MDLLDLVVYVCFRNVGSWYPPSSPRNYKIAVRVSKIVSRKRYMLKMQMRGDN